MTSKILAVDIDECVVDVWPIWLKWCNTMFNKNYSIIDVRFDYDLTNIFGSKAMAFWATPQLYQFFEPKRHCRQVLSKLKSEGWNYGFVSYTKKGHFESKCDFINHWFPEKDFIHNTKEKNFTRCTHFLDDRLYHLLAQPKDVKVILMDTPYSQNMEELGNIPVATDWKDVYNILTETN